MHDLFSVSSNPAYLTRVWDNYLEISTVLEKIKRLEDMKREMSKRYQSIDEFNNWLEKSGVDTSKFNISEFTGYDLGLKAECDFSVDQLIMQIPRKIIFSVENAAPELAVLQNDPLVQHMPHVALVISLLVEKHKDNSTWKPYLDILPSAYNTVLYMTASDLIELKGSPTLGNYYVFQIFRYNKKIFINDRTRLKSCIRL